MKQNAVKLTKNQGQSYHSEQGGIIVWIMVMVALFAALSYAVSQGSRSGTQSISSEQANLAATEILDYAAAVRRVVQELQINGCADTEISFQANGNSGYVNPNAPSDNSCHVFHPSGGGINASPDDSFETMDSITYVGASDLLGIGTNCTDPACADLYIRFRFIGVAGQSLCGVLNEKMGHTSLNPAPSTSHMLGAPIFQGTYGTHEANTIDFDGKSAACFNYSINTDTNLFYFTLIAR